MVEAHNRKRYFRPKIYSDFLGEVIITGTFEGSIDFDADHLPPDDQRTGVNTHAFLVKYDTDGLLQDFITFTGGGTSRITGLEEDSSGNIQVLGWYQDNVTFGPGQTYTGQGQEMFKGVVDESLNWLSFTNFAHSGDQAIGNSHLLEDSLYVYGIYTGNSVDFDPNNNFPGDTRSSVLRTPFIATYHIDGTLGSLKSIDLDPGTALYQTGSSVDRFGNKYLIGGFRGEVDLDPDHEGPYDEVDELANGGGILIKYYPSGRIAWVKQFEHSSSLNKFDIEANEEGWLFVFGDGMDNPLDIEPNLNIDGDTYPAGPDGIIFKYKQSGSVLDNFSIYLKGPDHWTIPHVDLSNTFPNQDGILVQGEPMQQLGCDWFKYSVRDLLETDVVFSSSSVSPDQISISLTDVDRDIWFYSSGLVGNVLQGTVEYEPPPDRPHTTCVPSTYNIKILLEGSYNDAIDKMETTINSSGHIPSEHIFNELLFDGTTMDYNGDESIYTIGFTNRLVDWVLVELRIDPDDPETTVAQRAVFVRDDGTLVEPVTGNPGVYLRTPNLGPFHVIVRHRNSLPIMSSSLLAIGSTYDFTTGLDKTYGTESMVQVDSSPTAFAMASGDGDLNQSITAFDFLNVWLPANGTPSGYHQADFNLDGDVTAFDFLEFLAPQ